MPVGQVGDAHGGVGRVDALPARARTTGTRRSAGRCGRSSTSTSSASGSTSTPAADVWMRPCDSVTGTRWTRCTPPSNFSRAYGASPGLGVPLRLHRDRDVLKPPRSDSAAVEDLGLPAAALGVAQVHPQQVAGEQRRLLAALAGLDLEDHVLVVVGVARDQQHAAAAPPSSPRRASRRSASAAKAASSAASSRAAARSSPSLPPLAVRASTTGAELGVALADPAGVGLVGVDAGSAELLLEVGVLGDERLDGLEHRDLLSPENRAPAQASETTPARRTQSVGADRQLLGGAVGLGLSWRTASRSGPPGHRCRGSSAYRCRRGGSCEQTSAWIVPLVAVLRVGNVAPQVQVTGCRRTSGWMSFFMGFLSQVAGSPPRDAGT